MEARYPGDEDEAGEESEDTMEDAAE